MEVRKEVHSSWDSEYSSRIGEILFLSSLFTEEVSSSQLWRFIHIWGLTDTGWLGRVPINSLTRYSRTG